MTAASSFGGIYAVSNPLQDNQASQLPSTVFSNPAITGIALSLNWATIEPGNGSYDWASIDGEITQAVASGKKISLAVFPNRFTAPSWLFQEGVQDLNFTVLNHGGLNNIDIAPPWDPKYQQAYASMMQALSDHLKSIPGAYAAVTMVKITGMSQVSAETWLPSATTTGGGVTNSIPIWQAAGYTPSKALAAWNGFADATNAAFSDKILSMESIATGAFPSLNEAGQLVSIKDPTYVDVVKQIIESGVSKFGNRFAVQWDGLNTNCLAPTVIEASQLGAIAGWQTNRYLGPDGSGAGSDWKVKIPLTPATFQQMLELGILQGGAQYLEVWPADLPLFSDILATAQQELANAVIVAPSSTAEIAAPTSGDAIFKGPQGTLVLDDSVHFSGYIAGFRGGDVIDLRDIAFGTNTKLSYTPDATNLNGTFTISDGVHSATIGLVGQYGAGNLRLASDGHGGTAITDVLVAGASPNIVATHNQIFAASSLFSASDPFAQKFELKNTGSGGAFFQLNGRTITNQGVVVTAAQLAKLKYYSGSGSDTLKVRISDDGVTWSSWSQSFTVTGPIDNGPVITAPDSSWGHDASPGLHALFTVSDPFNDPVTEYQFIDNTAGATSGYFLVNGVAQNAGQVIDLTAAQMSTAEFQTGWGTDNISVRAYDGRVWGAWTTFNVTAPVDPGPSVTAANLNALLGQTFAGASLFTAKDPFNDPIDQYDVRNNGLGGGTFYLNGVALAANQDNYLTAAQLAGLTYVSGAGVDTLQVRANEGGQWSAWANFTVSYDTGPAITAPNSSWGHGASPVARSLFTATDPVGLPIIEYQFIDNTADALSGYFMVNGVAQSAGQVIDLTAQQLASTAFQTNWNSDNLSMRAFDGVAWSNWVSFQVSPPVNPGPTVTAANLTAVLGQSFTPAGLFTAKNVFNSPIEQFDVRNSGAGGGTFYLNGVALAANQDNYLTAAQLAGLTYVTGSGADALQVRANEGGVWSAWANFTVSYNAGPVVTAPNSSWAHNASPYVRSLFTATDPSGLPIIEYQFIDRTAAATSGYFIVNGVAQAAQQVIDLTSAQLSGTEFQTSWTSDNLSMRAFDGVAWSNWVDFEVSPPVNPGPTVSASNLTAVLGQSLTPAGLFTAKNVFNDPIDQYDLTNSGAGGGTLYLNGVALAANQDNYLTAAQLAGICYVAGSGVDTVQVRASEGGQWSAWANFTVSYDSGPAITAPNSSWAHGANPGLRALFTATDPVGLAITEYQFIDNTPDALSGYFVVNGVAQSAGQVIDLTAAQLASASFQTSWLGDSLSMRAFDGTAWSAWTSFSVSPPVNPGPTVTAGNVTTLQGQTFAAANLFTAKNVFNSPIDQYDVWNSGAGGGSFYLNGFALVANQHNYLTAAQFAATTYVAGSGTDTLQVRASEGGVWSAWAPATIATATSIGPGAIVELASAFSGTAGFAANTGTLKLDNSASFVGTVAGYGNLDKIDLTDIDPTAAALSYSGNATSGTMTVSDGTHTANLLLLGQYSAAMFVLSADTHGGTLITETVAAQSIAVNHVT